MLRTFPLCCVLALITGCASVMQQSESRALETTLVAYGNAIRWGDLQQALPFIDPETLKAHPRPNSRRTALQAGAPVSYIEQPPIPAGPHECAKSKIGYSTSTRRPSDIVDNQLCVATKPASTGARFWPAGHYPSRTD